MDCPQVAPSAGTSARYVVEVASGFARRHGVKVVRDMVASIDPAKRTVKLASGGELPYDRLIVSPGIDFMMESMPGMAKPGATDKVLHAWKAGPQTTLRQMIELHARTPGEAEEVAEE